MSSAGFKRPREDDDADDSADDKVEVEEEAEEEEKEEEIFSKNIQQMTTTNNNNGHSAPPKETTTTTTTMAKFPHRPDEISPPGTKLRSGRKVKPQRSLEDKAMTRRQSKKPKLNNEYNSNINNKNNKKDVPASPAHKINATDAQDEAMENTSDKEDDDDDEGDHNMIITHDDDKDSVTSPPRDVNNIPTTMMVTAVRKNQGTKGGTTTLSSATSSTWQGLNLKLPSQHTPGRVQKPSSHIPQTAVAFAAASLASSPTAADQDEIHPLPPVSRMKLIKTPFKPSAATRMDSPPTGAEKATTTTITTSENGNARRHEVFQGVALAPDDTPPPRVPDPRPNFLFPPIPWEVSPQMERILNKTGFWFALVGVLLLASLWIINPFFDSAGRTAKILIPVYKKVWPSGGSSATILEPIPPRVEIREKRVLSEGTIQLVEQSRTLNETWVQLQRRESDASSEMNSLVQTFSEKSRQLETQVEGLESIQQVMAMKLAEILSTIEEHTQDIKQIATLSVEVLAPGTKDMSGITRLQEYLNETDAQLLLNTGAVLLWDPPLDICNLPELESLDIDQEEGEDEDEEETVVVTRDLVMEYMQELREELEEEFEALVKDKNWKKDILKWLEDFVDSYPLPEYKVPKFPDTPTKPHVSSTPRNGSTGATIRKLVDGRLEVDRADLTGRIDYAALYQGASLVRTGPSATSPSLVDTLPLLNRLLAITGTQFYGYGPEAALTPSYPADSVGQCWAVVEDANVNKFGSYAVLTVKLSKSIDVRSVSIEHPLTLNSSAKARSAIRSFRVYGYVDGAADTEPYDLGRFQFDVHNKKRKLVEEYELNRDRTIPKLASISLVIDSTWGMDYACLYRFRVHGRE